MSIPGDDVIGSQEIKLCSYGQVGQGDMIADSSGMSSPTYRRENGPRIGKGFPLSDIWDRREKVGGGGERAADGAVHSIENSEITEF